MDSTLIIDYLSSLPAAARPLLPPDADARFDALRLIGLVLAACEKTVQIVYEQNLRPVEKQHQPWLDRVQEQLLTAWGLLEQEAVLSKPELPFGLAQVTIAVGWQFSRMMLPEIISEQALPRLTSFSANASLLPEFIDTPAL